MSRQSAGLLGISCMIETNFPGLATNEPSCRHCRHRTGSAIGPEQKLWVRAQNISIMASVGIHRGEKDHHQEILLNIAAEVREPESDRIDRAVDYRTLVDAARRLAAEGHFELIETLACELGRRLIGLDRVSAVDIELFKPAAIAPAMASVRYHAAKPDQSS